MGTLPHPCLPVYCTASIYRLNIAHCWGVGGVQVRKYAIALPKHHIWIASQHHTLLPFTPMLALEFFLQRRKYFFVDQILSCAVRMEPDWMDWYFQTIARVKNLSCFRIMAVTVGAEFLSSLNKTWRQFSQFNLFERAPKIYPWLPLVTITSEPSMRP